MNIVQELLKMEGVDSNEVKMTVDTSKIGEMRLSLDFSNNAAFKRVVKYGPVMNFGAPWNELRNT